MEQWEINGFTLEYIDDVHQYIIDGVCVPSITQMLKLKFSGMYKGVDTATLDNAARKGTELHRAIETLCKTGEMTDLKEVYNFLFLQKHYKFNVVGNEIPVILFNANKPIAAGRLDLVLEIQQNDIIIGGLADIKRTSILNKEYLAYQLNLYRIAYMQSYGKRIDFLKGIHLRDDTRRFVNIPVNEGLAWEIINLYLEVKNDK